MNEGIHLDLDTWIVPGQIRKANLVCFVLYIIIFHFSLLLFRFSPGLTVGGMGFIPERL